MPRAFTKFCPISALDSLGFGAYKAEARAVLQEAKAVAAKKRRQSTKLENLGIPEEELLRQQQALFAKVRDDLDCCTVSYTDSGLWPAMCNGLLWAQPGHNYQYNFFI